MIFWRWMAFGTAVLGLAGILSGSLIPGLGLLGISVYSFRTAARAAP